MANERSSREANKATKRQSKRSKRETRVRDLSTRSGLARKIKGGAVDSFIWFEQPKAK
jgi:hypothetical protein